MTYEYGLVFMCGYDLNILSITEYLPRQNYEEVFNFVVLDPQWLMVLMKVIVELTTTHDIVNLSRRQLRSLIKDGVADFEVILKLYETCWKKFGSPFEVRHLCWVLQAYGFLFPIECNQHDVQRYIIPCKLPESINKQVYISFKGQKNYDYVTFYVDFCPFLPDEIYYELMSLVSSKCNIKGSMHNCYSKKCCFFFGFLNTTWVIEIVSKKRLKITVK